jgi:RNA polymerase sigma-70 factor (ECF subfamily)
VTGRPSFDEVFDEGLVYVLHVLRRLGVPERDRDDCAQDVFLAVYTSLPTYNPAHPLRPWLHGIAFHVVDNTYWRKRREVLVDDVADPIDQALDPEQATAKTMERTLLIRLMQELDLAHRAVISMHIDGVDMEDIARELGIAVSTGYKRLETARRTLEAAVAREPRNRRASGAVVAVPFSLAALFAADRTIPDVPADVRARLWSRVQAATRALPSMGVAPPSTPGSASAPAADVAKRVAKRIVPYVLGAAAGAGGMYLYMCSPRSPQPPVPLARSVPLDGSAGAVPPTIAPAPAGMPPLVTTLATAKASAPTAATAAEGDEQGLISEAFSAHLRGDTSGAIAALDKHARKYPHGELAVDREGLRSLIEQERLAGTQSVVPGTPSRPRR